ncbi:MAG: phosphoribosylformylglycinamidine cyclo-ligase [Thermoplasmata archaeon]|nr:phosphoribosylformylglycinamidine cyclo-ligase [Thermoplasmata archaeon]
MTYARSGVDRAAIRGSLQALLARVHYRPPPTHGRPISRPGHYAGLIDVGRETIAATTDTVGTKVLLAQALGSWAEVGEDMVAINVNDLASVGARPFGFVDTISCSKPEPAIFAEIGRGLDRGLRAGRCALLGGETAVVPEIVDGIDLGGTALGFYPLRRRPITGERIRAGDALIGIPSSGLHANGFTLARRLLKVGRVDLRARRAATGPSIGLELLRATRSYVAVSEALADAPGTHGFAHLSGGGVRNLTRLTRRVGFELDEWPRIPPVFPWLQALGSVSDEEMFQTFNMGVGFVVIVSGARQSEALERLRQAGVRDARRIGTVEPEPGVRLPQWKLSYEGYA